MLTGGAFRHMGLEAPVRDTTVQMPLFQDDDDA
jgi:hypothetical protein